RGRLQPGVMRALETAPLEANILDLGCAHGLLAGEKAGRDSGFHGVGQRFHQIIGPMCDIPPLMSGKGNQSEKEDGKYYNRNFRNEIYSLPFPQANIHHKAE
ncbi:hypothetical protein LCGC14_2335760, partial [marine sediment metagenome]